eukprot:374747_1
MRSLLLFLLFIGYTVYGQLDECYCVEETPACSSIDCPADCVVMGEGCYEGEEVGSFTTTTECDDDEDVTNWSIDYIGKSTQFRFYDPCDDKFIKIKMEDITEYDSDGGKTTNKETSFASSDWDWEFEGGIIGSYNGADAIYNKFVATELTKMDANFTLETIFFRQDVVIAINDTHNRTVNAGDLKFNVDIHGWDYLDEANDIVLCIGIMTNKGGDIGEDEDTQTFYFDEGFEIDSDDFASCGDGSEIDVFIERDGNGNNHLDLCYNFSSSCFDSGEIHYDPIVKITDSNAA